MFKFDIFQINKILYYGIEMITCYFITTNTTTFIYIVYYKLIVTKIHVGYRYWHRSLNPRKLIEVRFSHLSRNMTMQRLLKLYKLPSVGV